MVGGHGSEVGQQGEEVGGGHDWVRALFGVLHPVTKMVGKTLGCGGGGVVFMCA